jgi:hypothetical protein
VLVTIFPAPVIPVFLSLLFMVESGEKSEYDDVSCSCCLNRS